MSVEWYMHCKEICIFDAVNCVKFHKEKEINNFEKWGDFDVDRSAIHQVLRVEWYMYYRECLMSINRWFEESSTMEW